MSAELPLQANSEKEELSEQDAEVYDRQIRLWGLNAQKRLQASKILLVGLTSTGQEVCKNLVLAGVKELVLADTNPPATSDGVAPLSPLIPFSLSGEENRADACLAALRAMNPRTLLSSVSQDWSSVTQEYLTQFSVVCCCITDGMLQTSLDYACRQVKVPFVTGDTLGLYGYVFCDLGQYKYFSEENPVQTMDLGRKTPTSGGAAASPAVGVKKMVQEVGFVM